MSNSILISLQNISSSLKSLKNVVKADNFYDTIYCGKYYDRFSVKCDSSASFMYVIKQRNAQIDRFISFVERVSLYRDSPFVGCNVYREELLCYDGKNAGVFHDIVIVDNLGELLLTQYLLKNRSVVACLNLVDVVKSFTSAILWLIHYGIHINGFCGKNVIVSQNGVRFVVNERISMADEDDKDGETAENYNKKLLFALFSSWMLLLRADKNYKATDLMLGYLESYDLRNITNIFSEFTDEIDLALDSDFASVVDYVVSNKGDLNRSAQCFRKVMSISEDKIEQFCFSNHSSNSESGDNYDMNYGSSENRVIVRDKNTNKFGYINCYGDGVIECVYDEVTHFNEGIAVVGIDNKYFAINNGGERLMVESYDAIQWYCDINRFIVNNGGLYMLLNRAGEVISKREYSWIGEFSCGRSVVESEINGRKGYIDLDGNEITPISYDDALSFENGVGKVLFEGEWRTVIYDGDVI